MKETIYRRCGCRDPETKKQLGAKCPKLRRRGHAVYAIRLELPLRADGTRRSFARSGYETQDAAGDDRDKVRALLAIPEKWDTDSLTKVADLVERVAKTREELPDYDETKRRLSMGQELAERPTVAEYLDKWAAGRKCKKGTKRGYESHIRIHLAPHLGRHRLDRLNKWIIQDMFAKIEERNIEILEANALRHEAVDRLKATRKHAERRVLKAELAAMPPFRRVTGVTTQHRIKATLRKALNDAIPELITFNSAAVVELTPVERPKPMVWTDEHVEQWRTTGAKPSPVMVWTPAQTGIYLDYLAAKQDRLYAMWHLMCFRGLRRGEACGLRDVDVSEQHKTLTVTEQLVQQGAWTELSTPKSGNGKRVVPLDTESLRLVRKHRKQRSEQQLEWGPAWVPTGRLFTKEDGSMLYPEWVSEMHVRNAAAAGLPPVRLHDLRHGTASLLRAAGQDIKVIQETLGHATSQFTNDTYVHLYADVLTEAAEAAVKLVPRAGRTPS